MKKITVLTLILITTNILSQNKIIQKKVQDLIIEEYYENCAQKYNYNYEMAEWQNCLDQGLKKDKTIARLWQEKAMPYFKAKKYEVGMRFLDIAVKIDPKEYLPYRAFIKCIFAKTYKDALIDFIVCRKKYGNNYINDHTYEFYSGICYLQLNQFKKADELITNYNEEIFKNRKGLENPISLFYLGITRYEQKKYKEAIIEFDKALKIYPNFSDVEYYKAICLSKLLFKNEADDLFNKAEKDFKEGFSISEYNAIYEKYPYQVRWD
jgi:tetratricopeptide (TPR) repeat protein